MPRAGTLVVCVQNLDFSGANQVILNIVAGKMHEGNVIILSPKAGAFGARFLEMGATVRIGLLKDLLLDVRDVFCVLCNTIMTANIVVEMEKSPLPIVWILHEWWDDEQIKENLRIRNYKDLTLETVKKAMAVATRVVCVCDSQKHLYNPQALCEVIFVGVPDPSPRISATEGSIPACRARSVDANVFTFLCLGIICPRKNQLWTVKLFKQFAKDRSDVKLQIVGARYTRDYEIAYLNQLKAEIADDPRIEIFDVTDNVEAYYKTANCLILTSLNEVTPMVISEAMSWGIPVLSTNIAGIKEMYTDGVEGYHFAPEDEQKALECMEMIYSDADLRDQMSLAARQRFETTFDLDIMVESYRQLVLKVAPPVILIDMDGTLVDWDLGFAQQWKGRSVIDRSLSYSMEKCVPAEFEKEAIQLFHQKGFFLNLPWMEGAKQALQEMEAAGLQILLCTSPIRTSRYCAQEKMEWVRKHLGETWLDRLILCQDKTTVKGDILIDDKPLDHLQPGGKHTAAAWKQVLFDAPYNRMIRSTPRLCLWKHWRDVILPLLGDVTTEQYEAMCQVPSEEIRSLSSRESLAVTSTDQTETEGESSDDSFEEEKLFESPDVKTFPVKDAREAQDVFLSKYYKMLRYNIPGSKHSN